MRNNINRREFLEISALTGVGITLGGTLLSSSKTAIAGLPQNQVKGFRMNLTPLAITEDCASVVAYSENISKPFKSALSENWQTMRVGSLLGSNIDQGKELVISCKGLLKQESMDDFGAQKLAFMAGWIFHLAANRQLYPDLDEKPKADLKEKMIYQDVFLLREQAANVGANTKDVESLFDMFKKRTYLRIHTFHPSNKQVDNWIANLVNWSQASGQNLQQYAQIYSNPNPQKMQKYIQSTNFYNKEDSIIHLAFLIRNGLTDSSVPLKRMIEVSATQSQYARAVGLGVTYLNDVNKYMNGRISETALMDNLKLG